MSKDDARVRAVASLTAEIAAAYVSHNAVSANEVPKLIESIYRSLDALADGTSDPENQDEPAVSVRRSVKRDHIVCLEDGQAFKMLKRHLLTQHNMTPDEYRKKWNLESGYPMVAPLYAAKRASIAKSMGLGKRLRRKATKAAGRAKKGPLRKAA